VLEFQKQNSSSSEITHGDGGGDSGGAVDGVSIFAQSSVDLSTANTATTRLQQWLESVVDSSRYFVVKIQSAGGREALIGFGFRDRDQATDLRECLQYYERSIQREREANNNDSNKQSLSGSFSIPKMAEGEKIHVSKSGKTTTIKKGSKDGSTRSAVPLLMKKPPPPSSPEPTPKGVVPNSKTTVEKIAINMGNINLDDDHEEDESSNGAVYEGDDDQWATEFVS
jgi:Protein of unknown function (DUF1681)